MGKKAKAHRKKVQARNARIKSEHRKLGKELQAQFEKIKEQRAIQEAIAKNYESINQKLSEDKKQEILEQGGVRFSD